MEWPEGHWTGCCLCLSAVAANSLIHYWSSYISVGVDQYWIFTERWNVNFQTFWKLTFHWSVKKHPLGNKVNKCRNFAPPAQWIRKLILGKKRAVAGLFNVFMHQSGKFQGYPFPIWWLGLKSEKAVRPSFGGARAEMRSGKRLKAAEGHWMKLRCRTVDESGKSKT